MPGMASCGMHLQAPLHATSRRSPFSLGMCRLHPSPAHVLIKPSLQPVPPSTPRAGEHRTQPYAACLWTLGAGAAATAPRPAGRGQQTPANRASPGHSRAGGLGRGAHWPATRREGGVAVLPCHKRNQTWPSSTLTALHGLACSALCGRAAPSTEGTSAAARCRDCSPAASPVCESSRSCTEPGGGQHAEHFDCSGCSVPPSQRLPIYQLQDQRCGQRWPDGTNMLG